MKTKKNMLDEMQEQKLLKIEHNGCWLAFWSLLAVLLLELIMGVSYKEMVGEWLVFMLLALYLCIDCLRNGIWDRHIKATSKNNLLLSLAAGLIMGALYFFISYRDYGSLPGAAATAAFLFVFTFLACYIGLEISAKLYRKKVKKMEEDGE